MAAIMWKNSLKKVESDNNKILYETLLEYFLQRNGTYCLNKPRNYLIPTYLFFFYKGPTNFGSVRQPDKYSAWPDLNQQYKPHLRTAIYFSALSFMRVTRKHKLSPFCCKASMHHITFTD